jgi:hypothetical protein
MKKILSSGIIVLLSVSIMAQNSANLKMSLEKNRVYKLSSTTMQTTTQTVNGTQQTTETRVVHSISLKMIDATADFMINEIHLDTMKTNTNAMGKIIVVNSAVEGNTKSTEMSDVISAYMNRLSKNALYVKMDYNGRVIEIVNAKMLSDLILKDTSSIALTGMIGKGVKKQIADLIGEKTLKTTIEMFTYHLPGKQVSPGDNWDINVNTTTGGMSLDINTKYHLVGINDNSANLTVESAIKTSANAAPIISGPAKVTYDDIMGLSKSTIVLDTRTGLIIEDNAKTHISGNLGISGPGFNMTMPMDINGESKVISIQ